MLCDVRGLCARRLCAARLTSASAQPRSGLACSLPSTASETGSLRPADSAAGRLDTLFRARAPLLTLERSRGDQDASLWSTGAFGAGLYPDLPVATTWPAMLRRLSPWGNSAPAQPAVPLAGREVGGWTVATVAAQLRSRGALEARLLQRAGCSPNGERAGAAADALLLVSGSHPLRDVLAPTGLLPGALQLLRTAAALRTAGRLPRALSLWAVANPLVEDAARSAAKVECGAEVIVTQPPLVWPLFEAWLDALNRRGLTRDARVLVGLPMLTSASAFAFWLDLCRAGHVPGAEAAAHSFREADASGNSAAFCQQYTGDLIKRVLAMPGVAGLHVMPVTKRGRELAQVLVREQAFCVSQAPSAVRAELSGESVPQTKQ